MADDFCLTAHVFYTDPDGWALCVQIPGADPEVDNESWGEHLPTPAERAAALTAMGFVPVTRWLWRESPAHDDRHSLYGTIHVRRTAHAEPKPTPWIPNGGHHGNCAYVGGISSKCSCSGPRPDATQEAVSA